MNCFGTPDKVNQSYPSQIFSRKHLTTAWFISLGPALTVYRLTFYHTITWCSLLLTLAGWLFTRLPLGISDICL